MEEIEGKGEKKTKKEEEGIKFLLKLILYWKNVVPERTYSFIEHIE